VYRTLELPGRNPLKELHGGLDEAVMRAYGFSAKKDLLSQLLELNLEVSRREKLGERVVGPGVPEGYGDSSSLVSGDCVGNDERGGGGGRLSVGYLTAAEGSGGKMEFMGYPLDSTLPDR